MTNRRKPTKNGSIQREITLNDVMLEAKRYLRTVDFVRNDSAAYQYLRTHSKFAELKRHLDAKNQNVLDHIVFAGGIVTGSQADMIEYDMQTNLTNDGIVNYHEDYRKYRPDFYKYLNQMGSVDNLRVRLKDFIKAPYDNKMPQYRASQMNSLIKQKVLLERKLVKYVDGINLEDEVSETKNKIQSLDKEILYMKYQ